ncbi:MAG: BamA/TamA family outer membrane protein [Rhodospirillaceae bacterium]|nr:BamA/TamA family outer membrane protein [Rhodospirillaceae bacterium]MBT6512456.1 BamA/TamA family outer membrane protein [Rhodospirillaceae bacterium]MBT7645676.1 BamA/TamA family outer membrane protein [Rhodospirillaceae bacterium]
MSLVVGTPAASAEDIPDKAAEPATYEVAINVPDVDGVKALIFASSQLITLENTPPDSANGLQRRIESDVDSFRAVMRSNGYYDPDIRSSLEGDAPPYKVDISIAPGPRYTLAEFDIVFLGGLPDDSARVPTLADGGITLGDAAVADGIAAADSTLVRWLKNRGFPFAKVVDRLALADHLDRTVWIQLTLETGPLVTFGALETEGLVDVMPAVITTNITWQEGDDYSQGKVNEMRNRLLDANVFESVSIRPEGDADGPAGARTMMVKVAESQFRSISAGLKYSTDLGPELNFDWEHRNFFGEAEVLGLRTTIGTERQRLDSSLRIPDFKRRDQDLVIRANLVNEEFDAYTQTGAISSVVLEWPVNDNLRTSWGVATDFLEIDDNEDADRSYLLGLPVIYSWDDTDSLLDPTRGFRVEFRVTPWVGQFGEPVSFLNTSIKGSTYLSMIEDERLVLAVRGEFGTIFGEDLNNIPSNRRFYAGGGGSIRGYEFQKAGPLDNENDPTGGRSLAVFGAELRIKITEDIGIVPFYEGGSVFTGQLPDANDQLFWATGLGLRYYTAIGPVRFDVGIPLDRRDDIDDPFQIYVSLGQAF